MALRRAETTYALGPREREERIGKGKGNVGRGDTLSPMALRRAEYVYALGSTELAQAPLPFMLSMVDRARSHWLSFPIAVTRAVNVLTLGLTPSHTSSRSAKPPG